MVQACISSRVMGPRSSWAMMWLFDHTFVRFGVLDLYLSIQKPCLQTLVLDTRHVGSLNVMWLSHATTCTHSKLGDFDRS